MWTIIAIIALLAVWGPMCTHSDNLALLAGTLKTMQRAACDDEIVSLSCPRSTIISIQVAQYGKATYSSHSCIAEESKPQFGVEVMEEKCLWPNSMQYSLLQTVVEACQKKHQCKFSTKSKPGLIDPCPLARKFVEVAYKCRPHEFRSRTGCEDDVIKLSCNPLSRIAVLEAQFGRTAYEAVSCPQTQGVLDETCTAPYAVETVMQICHGKRRCQIVANSKTFGSPCKPDSKSYLKVVYACVPLGVLTERYESAAENDEINGHESDRDQDLFDESEDAGEKWREPNLLTPIINPALQPPEEIPDINKNEDFGKVDLEKNRINHDNRKATSHSIPNPKLLVYISVGIVVFIVTVCLIFGIRYYIVRKRKINSKNGDMFTTEAPNVFNDAMSDLDNDGDVSHISGTFYDPSHPDMILYKDGPGRTTLRAMKPLSTIYPCAGTNMYGNVDYVPTQLRVPKFSNKETDAEIMMSPKSLSGYTNSQFYYG